MDIQPSQPYPITSSSHKRTGNTEGWILLTVGLVIIAAAGYFAWSKGWLTIPGISPGSSFILVSSGPPLGPAYTISGNGKKVEPLVLSGSSLSVIDVVKSDKTTYYLLRSAKGDGVGLYTSKNDGKDVSLQTNASDIRFGLSTYNDTNLVAYSIKQSSATTTHIAVFNTSTNKETILGEGRNPSVLKGGLFVVYQRGNSVLSQNIQTKMESTLVTIKAGSSYAVNPETLKVAVYEPSIKVIQEFSIVGLVGASYISSSKPISEVPQKLFYDRKGMLTDAFVESGTGMITIKTVGGTMMLMTSLPSAYPTIGNVLLRYE